MSYIIENKEAFIPVKLTALGREKIASGDFNWSYWAIGDSEVDYRFSDQIPSKLGGDKILRPKDFNPSLKSYLQPTDCSIYNVIKPTDVKVVECCVHNDAKERGFFTNTGGTYEIITNETYVKTTGVVNINQLNGTDEIDLQTTSFDDGDFILFKINNDTTGYLNENETIIPVQYLWYKITKTPSSTIVRLDRNLPYYTFMNNVELNFYIYQGNEPFTTFFGQDSQLVYWNAETLEFQSSCDTTDLDVNVLNQNNIWNEDILGTEDFLEGVTGYGSVDYVGQKEYLGYNKDCPEIVDNLSDCENKLAAVDDDFVKGIGIIHYTNLKINNTYGEKFFINENEDKHLTIEMPTIMWHRRDFQGSTNGIALGMTFKTKGDLKESTGTTLTYYELHEDNSMINPTGTTISVGRVYPDLKIIAIHDEELLAVTSYKSNRNYSLPKLKGNLIFPVNGIGTGILNKGKTMYVTYTFQSDNGVTHILPHQKYLKYINNTKIDRDLDFTIIDTGLLPYMRKVESGGYDGLGFYAHNFKVLYQIVDNPEDRPIPDKWRVLDYTSSVITENVSETINPLKLENQIATDNGFIISNSSNVFYSLDILNIPDVGCPDELNFGDERFFWGNMKTSIGACIYKSVISVNIDSNFFQKTNNPTWNSNQNLKFNEVGLYDASQNLIAIAKISRPIEILPNSKFKIEISLDF